MHIVELVQMVWIDQKNSFADYYILQEMISPCQQPIVKVEYGEKSSQEQQDTYLALTITSLSTAHFLMNPANRLLFFRTKQVYEIAKDVLRTTVNRRHIFVSL